MMIPNKHVRGYFVGEECDCVCLECVEQEEIQDIEIDDVIICDGEIEIGFMFFCDRCDKEIKAIV